MITELLLTAIIVGLIVFIYFKDKEHALQINRLVQAIIAKSSQDYVNMTLSEKTKVDLENKPPLGPVNDEYIPMGSTDPDLFDRMITSQLNPDSGRSGEDGSPYESPE